MIVRLLKKNDWNKVKEIHERYYADEFSINDFFKNVLNAYVVENDNGQIIVAGSVRMIAEAVMLTDKSFSVRQRKEALIEMYRTMLITTGRMNFDSLHAFVQDSNWENQLKKFGFIDTKGKALVTSLG